MAVSVTKMLSAARFVRINRLNQTTVRLKMTTSSTDDSQSNVDEQSKEKKHIETPRFPGEMDPNNIVRGKIYDKKPFRLELQAGKKYLWCACGHSKNQPICDGTHRVLDGTSFVKYVPKHRPIRFTVEETKEYWLCNCKQTKNRPFCDGTHRRSDIQPFCDGSHKKFPPLKPVVFTVETDKTYSLCLCKHTGKAPFCDGTHRRSAEVKAAVIE